MATLATFTDACNKHFRKYVRRNGPDVSLMTATVPIFGTNACSPGSTAGGFD